MELVQGSVGFKGVVLAVVGGFALGGIALYRQEPINSLWIIVAAVCMYMLGYRFYAAWIAAKVFLVDPTRATPAERLNNGRDFVPTHKWVAFGHHFAAIAGPGPLVGPTLAGYAYDASHSYLLPILGAVCTNFIAARIVAGLAKAQRRAREQQA